MSDRPRDPAITPDAFRRARAIFESALAWPPAERDRLILEKQKAEDQRDAALSIAQDQLVPLLTTFVSTTETLIPLLQAIVRDGNDDHRRH